MVAPLPPSDDPLDAAVGPADEDPHCRDGLDLAARVLARSYQGLRVLADPETRRRYEAWVLAQSESLERGRTRIFGTGLGWFTLDDLACEVAIWRTVSRDQQGALSIGQCQLVAVFIRGLATHDTPGPDDRGADAGGAAAGRETAVRRLDIVIDTVIRQPDGPSRARIPKQVRKILLRYARKRLFFPPPGLDWRSPDVVIQDLLFLLCFYLVQAGFLSLETDRRTYHFLVKYLQTFRHVAQSQQDDDPRRVNALDLLWHLQQYYELPDDHRSLRKYLRNTIRGLRARACEQARRANPGRPRPEPATALPLWRAAEEIGCSRRLLYYYAARGKVQTTRAGAANTLAVEASELERLRQARQDTQRWRALAEALARQRGIQVPSARRWLARQRQKGAEFADLARAVRRERSQRGPR